MDEFVESKQVVLDALEGLEKARKGTTGLKTGFIDLDYVTTGLQPGSLNVVAARPAMGKSAFVLNIAQYVAIKNKKNVIYFSLEMSREQIMKRLFALEASVEIASLRQSDLKDEEWKKITGSAENIVTSGLVVDDTPAMTVSEMRAKCEKHKKQHNIDLIIIDYLQLVGGAEDTNWENRVKEMMKIARALRKMANELEVPIIVLSQLPRRVEYNLDHRPMLSDMRCDGAGTILQDADTILFIYRDGYYNANSTEKDKAEIIVAKNRYGECRTIYLKWLPQYTKFANYTEE